MLNGERHYTGALLAIGLVFLGGCAGTVMDVETLRAEGFQKRNITHITPSGERREAENYELWSKESREGERTVRVCLVPKIASVGYNWRVTVFVDDKDTWSYQSGPLSGKPQGLRRVIDCTVSRPLPEGRLSWQVNFTYWH